MTAIMAGGNRTKPGETFNCLQGADILPTHGQRKSRHELNLNLIHFEHNYYFKGIRRTTINSDTIKTILTVPVHKV